MGVYTIIGFTGHWPVGTSAVVVARDAKHAAGVLEDALERCGLPQKIRAQDFRLVETEVAGALILQDGDY